MLGSRALELKGLVKKSQHLQVYTVTNGSQISNHIYDDLGYLPGKHHILLKENAVPLVHAARLVPFALREKLNLIDWTRWV